MSQITGLWRVKNTVQMPNDTEIVIDGEFIVNTKKYIKSVFTRHYITQVIKIDLYEDETTFLTVYTTEESGWRNFFYCFWDFQTPLEVSDDIYAFFTANAMPSDLAPNVTVKYAGKKIFSLPQHTEAILHCQNKVMKTDLEISTPELTHTTVIPTEKIQEVYTPLGYGGFESFTVDRIPTSYLIPEGSEEITENKTVDVSKLAQVVVNVPHPPSHEVTITPVKGTQTETPPEGEYFNKVIVKPIPEEYIIPEGTKVIEENVENLDITQYKYVTVNALEAVLGKTYTCIAGDPIQLGQFVEFVINYGQGEFTNVTVYDIKVHRLDQEKILIDYKTSNNQREMIGLYLTGDVFHISAPLPYGPVNAYKSDFTVLNDKTGVCLWTSNEIIGTREQSSVYIQALQIDTDPQKGIDLSLKALHWVYSSSVGSSIEGAALTKINSNSVLVTMVDTNQGFEPIYYSVVKQLYNNWFTGIWGEIGYNYTNSNKLINLGNNNILSTWINDNNFHYGLITVNNTEILSYEEHIIENVTYYDIDSFDSNVFPLLTKTKKNELEIRTMSIGGTTVSSTEPIMLAENVEGPVGMVPINHSQLMILYPSTNQHLIAKFTDHGFNSINEIPNERTDSLKDIFVSDSFDLNRTSFYNALFIYSDEFGSSRYAQLEIELINSGYRVQVKESEVGTYVYPTESNTAIVGVAKTKAENKGDEVRVVRPS